MHKRHILFLAFVFCVVNLVGCGPSRGDLKGKVTYNGQVVKSGSVLVTGGNGEPKQGAIDREGNYSVDGIVIGQIKIGVSSPEPKGSAMRKKGDEAVKVDKTGWFSIPDKFADPQKSGLAFEIKSGPNTKDIDIK